MCNLSTSKFCFQLAELLCVAQLAVTQYDGVAGVRWLLHDRTAIKLLWATSCGLSTTLNLFWSEFLPFELFCAYVSSVWIVSHSICLNWLCFDFNNAPMFPIVEHANTHSNSKPKLSESLFIEMPGTGSSIFCQFFGRGTSPKGTRKAIRFLWATSCGRATTLNLFRTKFLSFELFWA